MSSIKVREAVEGSFEVDHELAGIVPMAIPSEQATLMANIKEFGQKEPIVLYLGKVVDGRCRQLALTMLGWNIMYKELDSSLTREEVEAYVKAVNTRRNLTPSQKIAVACREYLKNKGDTTQLKVAKSWGISDRILKNALWLHSIDEKIIDILFDGGSLDIIDKHGKPVKSNKVTSIYAYYKKLSEAVTEDTSHAWTEDSYIKTQAGKDWYYSKVGNITCIHVRQMIAELANYKFSKEPVDEL
jgi:ParB-like chromosome segregation protein Spo0J